MNRKPGSSSFPGLLFSQAGPGASRSHTLSLVSIGFASMISQILLLREFLVSFYGNELSIGILFACWLLWIGLGSAAGNWAVSHLRSLSTLFIGILAAAPLVTGVQILAVKFVRAIIHTNTGELLSLLDLLGYSFLVLSGGCFLWGLLYTLGAALLNGEKGNARSGVNRAYILESSGSAAGGLFFSFVFVNLFSTLQILLVTLFMVWSIVIRLAPSEGKRFTLTSFAMLAAVCALLLQPVRSLEYKINAAQWSSINPQLTFIRSMDTKYQNLSLLRSENQHTVFSDGRPAYTIPNTYDAELLIHSIMVQRPDAKRVLILGGGFNGVLREILKYPVGSVEYVENDPALVPFVEPATGRRDRDALNDLRVRIISADGREYLRGKMTSYDVIVMNVGEPSTASLNRFYTVEFFRLCRQSLTAQGIFAFSFPSSAEYLAGELKYLNACLYRTFRLVFDHPLLIPGTHAVLIGTPDRKPLMAQPDTLALRYSAAGISAEYFSRYSFEELMPPDRVQYITRTLDSAVSVRVNTDRNPVAYYYDILLWNRFLQGGSCFIFMITPNWIVATGVMIVGSILLMFLLQRRRPEKQRRSACAAIVAACGMTGMAMNILLLLNFQETFGSIFEMAGAMMASNMLGLAFGALAASRLPGNVRPAVLLLAAVAALFSAVLLLPLVLDFLISVRLMPFTLGAALFSGGLVGTVFGLVNRIYLQHSSTMGSMYAFDVFGSSLGALTICSVLLPVLGIQNTALVLALILCPALAAAGLMKTSFGDRKDPGEFSY